MLCEFFGLPHLANGWKVTGFTPHRGWYYLERDGYKGTLTVTIEGGKWRKFSRVPF